MPRTQLPTSSSSKCSASDLELLAPARNLDIGIAAIDCGADAVYIAGPQFGARQQAGNPVADIRQLCRYARRFGVRIFVTVNTLVYEDELPAVRELLSEVAEAGADGVIVQDPAVAALAPPGLALHASTQCAIRTPERARLWESFGFSRLTLERELSLDQIRQIAAAVSAEIECFVHGALCVCYSGQCYLSQYLAGRSANRGACIQACRSRYDLTDAAGHTLVRGKALLSLKDYSLLHRLGDLAEAGVTSFKIEGRLKNASYVKNTVRAYSEALDALVQAQPSRYRRASFGRVTEGFTPDLNKTFNRGYTELFLDGVRSRWAAMDAPKSMGEEIGAVARISPGVQMQVTVKPRTGGLVLHNGDGFSFMARNGEIIGFRGDVCRGHTLLCKPVPALYEGARLFRNFDAAFEKTLTRQLCRREISVTADLDFAAGAASAASEDGRRVHLALNTADAETASNPDRMRSLIAAQLSKRTGHYRFRPGTLSGPLPLLSSAALNRIRRSLAAALDEIPCRALPLRPGRADGSVSCEKSLTYQDNLSNSLSRALYASRGASEMEDAYEISPPPGAELMRTKYCVRFELGLCPRSGPASSSAPLRLLNGGHRLTLAFDCASCEMTVHEAADKTD